MKERLEKRLKELQNEMEIGKEEMQKLDERKEELHATLLRISGAIQVLQEELNKENTESVSNKESIDK